jgi:hypothetical protein
VTKFHRFVRLITSPKENNNNLLGVSTCCPTSRSSTDINIPITLLTLGLNSFFRTLLPKKIVFILDNVSQMPTF